MSTVLSSESRYQLSVSCSFNVESIQSEANALITQLRNAETKVSSSPEDLKEQYLSTIQVQSRLRPLREDTLTNYFGRWKVLTCPVWLSSSSSVVFPQESLASCEQLQQLLSSVEDRRTDLSSYLCEDSSNFSLDELFNTIKTFRALFLRAIKVSQSQGRTASSQSGNRVLVSQTQTKRKRGGAKSFT